MSTLKQLSGVCLVVLALSSGANAEDGSEDGWKWRLAPLYLWAVQMEGSASVGPPAVVIDIDLSTVFDAIDGAFTANFGGIANNRWGFWVDFTWLDISGKQGLLNVDFEYIQSEVDGFYRMPTGLGTIDWLFGVRYYNQDFKLSPTPVSASEAWVDPVVGMRAGTCRSQTSGTCCSEVMSVDSAPDRISPGKRSRWSTGSHGNTRPSMSASARWPSTMRPGADRTSFKYDGTTWGPVIGFSLKW